MRNTIRKGNDEVLNSMLTLALCTCIVSAFIIKCTPLGPKKPMETTTSVSGMTLSFSQPERVLNDVESFRMESALKIAGYDLLISDIKISMAENNNVLEADREKVTRLEQKNSELKKQITQYEYNGKKNWKKFRASVNSGIKQIERELQYLALYLQHT